MNRNSELKSTSSGRQLERKGCHAPPERRRGARKVEKISQIQSASPSYRPALRGRGVAFSGAEPGELVGHNVFYNNPLLP